MRQWLTTGARVLNYEVLIHLDHVTDYRPLQSPRWRSYSKIKI
jgi:hypothetical protein